MDGGRDGRSWESKGGGGARDAFSFRRLGTSGGKTRFSTEIDALFFDQSRLKSHISVGMRLMKYEITPKGFEEEGGKRGDANELNDSPIDEKSRRKS